MKYFVLVDLGYDGIYVNQYDEEKDAKNEYDKIEKEVGNGDTSYDGVALIKGEIIANNKLFL
jgi:hypothetical protein